MYPKNAASPPRIYVGAIVQISDGAVQTSGVAVTVTPEGGSETAGGGTIAYSTKGGVWYTPTQAETNYSAFVVEASKTGCIPAGITVVTTLSATAGQVVAADTQKVDINTIKTQAITAGAGVTVGAYVGNATAALAADANGRVQVQVGTSAGQIIASSGKVPSTIAAGDIATDAITAAAVKADAVTKLANGVLTPDMSTITGESARSVVNALRFLRNKWTLVGTTLTVYKEDDTTVAWTATVGTTAGANPVTSNDPA